MVFIVLYVILLFARSPAYHHAHTIDTYSYFCYGYFGCQCSIVEKSPWEGSKKGGYALDLYKYEAILTNIQNVWFLKY